MKNYYSLLFVLCACSASHTVLACPDAVDDTTEETTGHTIAIDLGGLTSIAVGDGVTVETSIGSSGKRTQRAASVSVGRTTVVRSDGGVSLIRIGPVTTGEGGGDTKENTR